MMDEVIEKIEENFNSITNEDNWENNEVEEYYSGYEDAKCFATSVLRDYKKEQTVEVPRIVADWIDLGKKEKWKLIDCFDENYEFWVNDDEACPDSECDKWVRRNSDLFARAWINGYTVKEEPLNFQVGEYYHDETDDTIFRVAKINIRDEALYVDTMYNAPLYITKEMWSVEDFEKSYMIDRKATDEEIALFQRAEMYHARGRKLDELKIGDLIYYRDVKSIVQAFDGNKKLVKDVLNTWRKIEDVELYLTNEELQKAHDEVTE